MLKQRYALDTHRYPYLSLYNKVSTFVQQSKRRPCVRGRLPISLRGRARVRAVLVRRLGREYPSGHLRCEFEVGLSPKNARAGVTTETAFFVKLRPVQTSTRVHCVT